jgi:hypothetical protein
MQIAAHSVTWIEIHVENKFGYWLLLYRDEFDSNLLMVACWAIGIAFLLTVRRQSVAVTQTEDIFLTLSIG